MKTLIIGDQHLADRPPSARTETYREDILKKLEWIIDRANDEDVDVILNEGDVFHIKRPDRNSHYLLQETARIFGRSKAPVRIVPGNHDLQYDSLDSIPSQPLGSLTLQSNISLLMGADPEFPIYGVPYFDPTGENLRHWVEQYHSVDGPTKYPLMGTHQAIFPKKEEPIYDYISAETWAESFQAKWVAYGHIHTQMKAGAHYSIGGTWFCNEGSISRGSLHESSLNRKPTVALFDSTQEGDPFTTIDVPFRPASEVFKLESVEIIQHREAMAEAFLGSLGSDELQYLTVEGILDNARSSDILPREAFKELEDIISNVLTD